MSHLPLIRAATQTLIDHVDELTALDSAIGDGDHGLNMKRGSLALQAKLAEWEGKNLTEPERNALLAGDVATLYRMGVNSFLMGYLCRFEVCGLTLDTYNTRIRSAAPQGH